MALEPEVVETLSPMVRRITANNPGVFTGPGTNTYLVGDGNVTVIDPGPAMDTHAQAIADAPGTITQIIVTHTHLDHSPGAQLLQKKLGVPAYGLIAAYPQHQDPTFKAAALIEMIHVATLIHDDVVDEADIRRGWPSVGRIWKNKVAILVGDYLFSNALSKICDIDDWDALRVLSKTAKRLSRGEIMQIESALSKDLDEDGYLKMVKDKTSSLISAATLIGAITATKNQEQRDALFNYGEKLGTMFQIKDDLLDITGLEREVGKPTMFDLKKNMLTLPIIHILSTQDKTKRKQLISDLKYLSKKNKKKKIK